MGGTDAVMNAQVILGLVKFIWRILQCRHQILFIEYLGKAGRQIQQKLQGNNPARYGHLKMTTTIT